MKTIQPFQTPFGVVDIDFTDGVTVHPRGHSVTVRSLVAAEAEIADDRDDLLRRVRNVDPQAEIVDLEE